MTTTTKGNVQAGCVHMQYVETDFMIHSDDLKQACDDAGLDAQWRRDPVRMSRAFTRAVKAVALPEYHEVRQVNYGKEEIAFEVVSVRGGEGERENTYEHKCSIVFDRTTNQINVPYCGVHTADAMVWARDTRDLFRKFGSHNATDIREMALKFLRTRGIKIMPGMYYVPPSAANNRNLEALKAVFKAIKCDLPAMSDVAVWARKSIETEIEQITAKLDSIDPDKARESTLGNKMDEFNQLRGKIELIASTLQFKADDLQDRITDVATKFRSRMLGEFGLPDAHKPAPVTPAPVIPIASARTEESTPNVDDIMSMIGSVDDEVGF